MEQIEANNVAKPTNKAPSTFHTFCLTALPLISVLFAQEFNDYFGLQAPYKHIFTLLVLAVLMAVNLALVRCATTREMLYKEIDEGQNFKELVYLWLFNWFIVRLLFRD